MVNKTATRAGEKAIPLNFSPAGKWLKILSVPKGMIFVQFIRFGLNIGERIRCIERLPGGTVVVQKNRQQIAIGHTLARQIFVLIVDTQEA